MCSRRGHRRRRYVRVLATLLFVLATAACSSDAPPGSTHRFTVTQENGVEVALTTGGPKFEGELFAYERVLEIRPDPEVEESFLWGPQWMRMSEDGRIYVSDMSADQIVVFDAAGKYLQRIGAKGPGPGEFGSLALIDIFGDTLWGMNMRPQGSHVFDLDGDFLRTVTIPEKARGLAGDARWWGLSDERLAIFKIGRADEDGQTSGRAEVYVIDGEGNVLADIRTPWVPSTEWMDPGRGEGRIPLEFWFHARPWADFARDRGLYVSDAVESEVRVYDFDGNLSRIIRIDLPLQPVSDDDRAWAIGRLEEDLQRALNPGDGSEVDARSALEARVRRDNPRYVDPKPHWSDIKVDDRGFIWLWSHTARELPEGKTRWFVLSPEGEYLGQTVAPGFAQVHRGRLFANEEDLESGEPMPVVYRIRPMVEGFEY